jgi:hypothetical protein
LQRFANRESRGAPPVAWVLLGPAGLRAGEVGVLFRARGEDCAVLVEDCGAGSACADVDTEDWNIASCLQNTCAKSCFRHPHDEGRIISRNQVKKAALLSSVNVHGAHLRPGAWACQRAGRKDAGTATRLTSHSTEHTMPAPKHSQAG